MEEIFLKSPEPTDRAPLPGSFDAASPMTALRSSSVGIDRVRSAARTAVFSARASLIAGGRWRCHPQLGGLRNLGSARLDTVWLL